MVGRNPVDSPVEVGSLSQYTSQVVGLGISSINRMGDLFLKTEWRLPQRPVIFVQRTLTFVLKQARVKRSLQVIEIILPRYCQNHPPVEPPEVLSLGQQPSPKKRFLGKFMIRWTPWVKLWYGKTHFWSVWLVYILYFEPFHVWFWCSQMFFFVSYDNKKHIYLKNIQYSMYSACVTWLKF